MLPASSRTSKTWATQKPSTDSIPVAQPYRRIPPHQLQEVQEHIKGLLAQKVVVESHSPYAAPVVIVRKKDGGIRLCVDIAGSMHVCPLPRIPESFDALVGAQFFSTLDLASGYHQIAMHPNDQHKTVFVTPMGLFEYTRMPMGLSSAPATFQRLTQSTMSDFIFQFLLVYLDYLLVYSKTFVEHLAHLGRLLQRIIDVGWSWRWTSASFYDARSTQLFGLRQLLPMLHPGLLEDCWSPPWPGRQAQRTSQEERGRHLQPIWPAAPEGVWRAEDSPDYSSFPGVCRVHQALHPRDRRQPKRAERHPLVVGV